MFFLPFRVCLASMFAKSSNMTPTVFLAKFKIGIKNIEFYSNFKSAEKVAKTLTLKKIES
jgi:hypothetical protein